MALDITPGYDFTVNEVPTNAKLRSMLDLMIITGIPRASVDGSIAGLAYGWLTGATMQTLANVGDMLYDLDGRLFVKTNQGVAQLYNGGQGGYETVRFPNGAPTEPAITHPVAVDNFYGQIESLTAGNQAWTNVYYRPSTTQGQNGYFIHQVTTVSGSKTRVRLVGSGRVTVLWDTGTWPRNSNANNDVWHCVPVEKSTVAVNEWKVTEFPHINHAAVGLGSKIGMCGSQEDNNIRCPCYSYGFEMMVI